MGAWGVNTFENDTAADWALGLESTDDLSYVLNTLSAVESAGEDYLDSELACEALAACGVVARLKDNWGQRTAYSYAVDRWVEQHPQALSAEIVERANGIIDRVLRDPSELRELWEESEEYDAWIEAVGELRNRVVA